MGRRGEWELDGEPGLGADQSSPRAMTGRLKIRGPKGGIWGRSWRLALPVGARFVFVRGL